jgi:hypothetical protein
MKFTFYKGDQTVDLPSGARPELEALKVVLQNNAASKNPESEAQCAARNHMAAYFEQWPDSDGVVSALNVPPKNGLHPIQLAVGHDLLGLSKRFNMPPVSTFKVSDGEAYDRVVITSEPGDCAKLLEVMSKKGFDPNYCDGRSSAMSYAIFNGNMEAVQTLNKLGVEPTRELLEKAAKFGQPEILDFLLQQTKHKDLSGLSDYDRLIASEVAKIIDAGEQYGEFVNQARMQRILDAHSKNIEPMQDAHVLRTIAHQKNRVNGITTALMSGCPISDEARNRLKEIREDLARTAESMESSTFAPTRPKRQMQRT